MSYRSVNPRTGAAETHRCQVRVPPGVREGQSIRIPGQGDAGQGDGPAGDLYLQVHYAPHPDFRVEGADLVHELALAPWEAVLGTVVAVPTLMGSVSVRIPPGTPQGQRLRVAGRGLPSSPAGPAGDLHIVVSVRIPSRITQEERRLWEQLAQAAPRKA